jgi:inositol polyphosphate 5-phosphatase INPP5B/F
VVIGTWNVNQKIPKKNLNDWLQMNQYEADIYACGLQEIDMSASSLLKEETEAGDAWDSIFENTFDATKYERINSKQLVGLYNCVYVKKSLLPYLEDARMDESGVGALGMMGNKGGIGIRFKLYESTLCFFTAHLAAKQSKITQRNQNFHDIMNNTTFGQYLEYHPYNHEFQNNNSSNTLVIYSFMGI